MKKNQTRGKQRRLLCLHKQAQVTKTMCLSNHPGLPRTLRETRKIKVTDDPQIPRVSIYVSCGSELK